MKKPHTIFFSIAIIIATSNLLQSQSWVEMMRDPTVNFYDLQKTFNDYWSDSSKAILVEKYNPGSDKPVFEKKLPGWKVFKRWENMIEPRVYPSGDRMVMINAMDDFFQNHHNDSRGDGTGSVSINAANWTHVGPTNVPTGGGGAGRINFIRFDPSNSNTIYVGSPSGGLWKSTNGGTSWTTNTDNLAVIGCTDLAIHPTNTQIMYLATGDGDANDTYSIGVLKSTNGGSTWNTTGLNWTVNTGRLISRLLINPQNPNTVYAATSNGVYRTRNAGATWTQVITTSSMYDIEFKPGDTTVVYACSSDRFYKSTNGGTTFTNITSGLPATTSVIRMAIAVSAANDSYVYLLASGNNSGFYGIYRSADEGTSFSTRATSPNLLGWSSSGSDSGGQGWYDLSLGVSPIDAEQVLVGGINIWASSDGGSSWTLDAYWASSGASYVHADIHGLEYLPGSSSTYFAASDGGLFKTVNSGSVWTNLSNGLQIGQIYRLGLSATNNNYLLTGWQDNGSSKYTGTSWTRVLGGDGMECIIDWSNVNVQYAELYYGEINKTTTGGNISTTIVNSGGTGVDENGAWVTPYIQSPTNASTLFVGKSQVWKSTNAGTSWTQVGTIAGGTGKIIALANAPSNPNYIYAAKTTKLFVSTNGTSFTDISAGLPVATVQITYIAVHPTDPNKVWVTFTGYSGSNKVFYSSNAGASWTNYSTGLPNLPVNCIVFDKNSTNSSLYVGTDVGVYYRNSTSGSWVAYNTGLPNVVVNELEIQYTAQKLRAATFGRGVWETDLYSTGVGVENVNKTADEISIFPNPNKGIFTISFVAEEKSNYTIQLCNSIGQIVYSKDIKSFQGQFSEQLDISVFDNGFYLLKVDCNNKKISTKRIIKN